MAEQRMSLEDVHGWLSTLCAYLPHVAPRVIDPVLVRHWHNELAGIDVDLAAELAQRLSASPGRRFTFPTRQEFAELRRDHATKFGGLALGQIDNVGSARAAAHAAARAARDTPPKRSA